MISGNIYSIQASTKIRTIALALLLQCILIDAS